MITLELTPEEAQTLHLILRTVGGDPAGTRGYATSMLAKLDTHIAKFHNAGVHPDMEDNYNSLYFKP